MKRRGRETVEQFLARLERDPEYVRGRQQFQARARHVEAAERREQADLLRDLAGAGVCVDDVWELVNSSKPYPKAVSVLLNHLDRSYSTGVREGIARALAVQEAAPIWGELRTRFLEEQEPDVKWALACAMSGAAHKGVLKALVCLLRDKRLGQDRIAWIPALTRLRYPETDSTLRELREDPDLTKEIDATLRKRKGSRPGGGR